MKAVVLVMTVLLALAAVVFDVGLQSHQIPPAYCIDCQNANDSCGLDLTKTSAMDVQYIEPSPSVPASLIEPDDATSWQITAYWRQPPYTTCYEYEETATVDVTWNGSSWQTSNEILANHILDIAVCDGDECSGTSGTHSWNYKLIADITDVINDPVSNYNLAEVKYRTTSVPDGYEIVFGHENTTCDSLGASVSPTSQFVTGWDDPNDKWSSSRCPFSCSVAGGSMEIDYQ